MARTLVLDLHSDLATWLEAVAERRGLGLEEAVSRLLDEERMRDLYLRRIAVPADNDRCWVAKVSARGLMYSGNEPEWILVPVEEVAKHLD